MKSSIVAFFFTIACNVAGVNVCLAQENDDVEYIDWSASKIDIQAGLSFVQHQVNSNLKPGLVVHAHISNQFILGAFGQLTTGNFAFEVDNTQRNIMTRELGAIIGMQQSNVRLIHLGAQVKVGYISLMSGEQELKLFSKQRIVARDRGLTLYPELNATINIHRQLRFTMGSGFNVLMLQRESILPDRALDTWFFSTSLYYRFRKKSKVN